MADARAELQRLRGGGVVGHLDWHFARTLTAAVGETDDRVGLAAGLVSRALSQGHVCLDLRQLCAEPALANEDGAACDLAVPALEEWLDALRASPMCGARGVLSPLVLEGERLYTRRYWRYETALAETVRRRCREVDPGVSAAAVRSLIDRHFGAASGDVDWQRVAATVSVYRTFNIVSGGPGTGKTFTVAKMLCVLAEIERSARDRLPDVVLMAPTGKAAQRLGESMLGAAESIDAAPDVLASLAQRPTTIHRALGRRRRTRTRFRHDRSNPLQADVVVIDEASMVDMALMSRALDAVPLDARVILLGDRDQLASVEAGAILADLYGDADRHAYTAGFAARLAEVGSEVPGAATAPPIRDGIVSLRRNYRYGADSAIGRLAAAINRGAADEVLELLASEADSQVELRPSLEHGVAPLLDTAAAGLSGSFSGSPQERLRCLRRFRILSPLRRGPFGVEELNRQAEARMRSDGLIATGDELYAGKPIMVVQNDVEIGLFNGDVGVLVDGESGGYRAAFADGEDVRLISLARIPVFETVYATTVHKSQGSEFEEVSVVLPDRISPLLTRELMYTAVTRARQRVVIYGATEVVAAAVGRRVTRASGLRGRLWGDGAE